MRLRVLMQKLEDAHRNLKTATDGELGQLKSSNWTSLKIKGLKKKIKTLSGIQQLLDCFNEIL